FPADPSPSDENILYVNQNVVGGNGSGDSWANALPELVDALQWAKTNNTDPLQIWVAKGIYLPTADSDRTKSFELVNNVAVYGGFAGIESDLEDRDWEANETILSGDLNGDDGTDFANNGENSHHVIFNNNNGLNATALLDGFIIRGGNATPNIYPNNNGGGMFNDHSSPAIINCIFIGNRAVYGGGMNNHSSSPVLTNVTLSGNHADFGGGMFNF